MLSSRRLNDSVVRRGSKEERSHDPTSRETCRPVIERRHSKPEGRNYRSSATEEGINSGKVNWDKPSKHSSYHKPAPPPPSCSSEWMSREEDWENDSTKVSPPPIATPPPLPSSSSNNSNRNDAPYSPGLDKIDLGITKSVLSRAVSPSTTNRVTKTAPTLQNVFSDKLTKKQKKQLHKMEREKDEPRRHHGGRVAPPAFPGPSPIPSLFSPTQHNYSNYSPNPPYPNSDNWDNSHGYDYRQPPQQPYDTYPPQYPQYPQNYNYWNNNEGWVSSLFKNKI